MTASSHAHLRDYCQLKDAENATTDIAPLICRLANLTQDQTLIRLPEALVTNSRIVVEQGEVRWGAGESSESVHKTEYPMHAGLLALAPIENFTSSAALVIVAIMVATNTWRQRLEVGAEDSEKSRKMFENSQYEVWLAVRKLPMTTLEELSAASFQAMYSKIATALTSEEYDQGKKKHFGKLERFWARFLGIRERTSKRSAHASKERHAEPGPTEIRIPSLEGDPDGETDYPAMKVWSSPRETLPLELEAEAAAEGHAPEEVRGQRVCFQDREPMNVTQGDSPKLSVLRSRSNAAHIRRNAQLLPGRWSQLTDAEIAEILRTETTQESSLRLLILLTGRPAEQVVKIRVLGTRGDLPPITSAEELFIDTETRSWIARIQEPVERRKVKSEWTPVLERHLDTLVMPIPQQLWEMFSPLLVMNKKKGKITRWPLFGSDKARLDELCRDVTILKGTRPRAITQFRIEQQLFSEILALEGDLVEASLITNRQPPYGTTAATYYHWCRRERLVDFYRQVTARWEGLLGKGPSETAYQQALILEGSVGSDLCLAEGAIKALISDFKADAERWRDAWAAADLLPKFHNAFTNYVLLMVLFLTGHRVVRDVLERRSDYDALAGSLVITDKTGDDQGHSRMVPVCETLKDQLEAYEQHSARLRRRIQLMGGDRPAGFLFYLTEEGELEPVTPKTIRREFSWNYTLHLNANRHYLRGALRERSVPGGYVDAFMGHWNVGREPTGRFSGFDPAHYLRVVGAGLEHIAKTLGFERLEGFWMGA